MNIGKPLGHSQGKKSGDLTENIFQECFNVTV